MKKIVFLSSLVLAATVAAAPTVAFAQEVGSTDCADAVVALTNAQNALNKAVADDEALQAAQADDRAEADAKKALDVAVTDALSAGVPAAGHNEAGLKRAKAGLAKAESDFPLATRTPEQQAQIDHLKKVVDVIRAVLEAQRVHADAKTKADKTNVDDLKKTADAADAAEAKKARDAARADFERLCGPGNPPPSGNPPAGNADQGDNAGGGNTTPDDSDFDQVGSVPVGGVATGGGPA